MTNTCNTCGTTYQLTPANSVIFLVEANEYMDHAVMKCSKGHEEALFFLDRTQRQEFITKHNKLTVVTVKRDSSIQTMYEETFGFKLLSYHELTDRHEKEITKLGIVLQKMPDEVLLELFKTPPPKSQLPMRWE